MFPDGSISSYLINYIRTNLIYGFWLLIFNRFQIRSSGILCNIIFVYVQPWLQVMKKHFQSYNLYLKIQNLKLFFRPLVSMHGSCFSNCLQQQKLTNLSASNSALLWYVGILPAAYLLLTLHAYVLKLHFFCARIHVKLLISVLIVLNYFGFRR